MFDKKFEIELTVPGHWTAPPDTGKRWGDNSKNAAEIAYQRLLKKVGFDEAFISQMAIPSNLAYRAFVNPGYLSKGGRSAEDIINAQAKNMSDKFKRWLKNLNRAYAEVDGIPAKAYKDNIDAAVDSWLEAVAKGSIRFTGDKIRGRSAATIASFYLAGDPRATAWIREGDVGDGAPYNITLDRERNAVKAALQQHFVQGGMLISHGEYQPAIIKAHNQFNAVLLNKLREPARCDEFADSPLDGKCFCCWEMKESIFVLHILVGVTV